MRVNARLEGEYERKMEFLTEATGLGVSEVLKASVEHYYKLVSAATQPRLESSSTSNPVVPADGLSSPAGEYTLAAYLANTLELSHEE